MNALLSIAFIGLGSNLNHPKRQIQEALDALNSLQSCANLSCAPWYASKAIGPEGQPDYINTVASIETSLTALDLLRQLQTIENQQGRQRDIRWGARTLDLDLLLYDNVCLETNELQLPHPEIQNRSFVLVPLYDLAPSLILPLGESLEVLANHCDRSGLQLIE